MGLVCLLWPLAFMNFSLEWTRTGIYLPFFICIDSSIPTTIYQNTVASTRARQACHSVNMLGVEAVTPLGVIIVPLPAPNLGIIKFLHDAYRHN